jgi:hypothetical protein
MILEVTSFGVVSSANEVSAKRHATKTTSFLSIDNRQGGLSLSRLFVPFNLVIDLIMNGFNLKIKQGVGVRDNWTCDIENTIR